MKILIDNLKQKLLAIHSFSIVTEFLLNSVDFELYVAGGAVRDYFINPKFEVKDIDLFYKGNPNEFIYVLEKNGEVTVGPFGSLRWFPKNEDSIYYDIISIVDFNNGVEKCLNMNDILNQFDFTVNSVAFSLNTGKFFNPINGLLDIKNKILKMVRFDYPNEIISTNVDISRVSVLWFRLLHYSNKLGFEIDSKTWSWLIENKECYNDLEIFEKYFFNPIINQKLLAKIV